MPRKTPGKKTPGKGRGRKGPSGLDSDMEDDVDVFHKQRDRIGLDSDDEPEMDGSSGEEAVMGLNGDVSDDSSGEALSDLEDVDDITSDDDEHISTLKAQAKALKQRIRMAKGGEPGDSDEEDDENAEERKQLRERLWGAGKRAYYGADEDSASDEEDAEQEEKEALRLQREQAAGLRAQDLGLDSDESDEEDEDSGDAALGDRAQGGPRVEQLSRDPGAADDAAREAAVLRDAPELAALVKELRGSLREVRSRVAPLLALVREGGLATDEGISYLEAKHLLLLSYCSQLVFYLLAKAEGQAVRDHPVVERLVETRAYLDKIRPIDKKLKYQVDKLLRAAETAGDLALGGGGGDDGDLALKANPDAMVLDDEGGADADGGPAEGGVYVAPKLRDVAMEEDLEAGRKKKEARAARERRARAERSELVRELEEEITGAPRELRVPGGGGEGSNNAFVLRERQRAAEREQVEEDLMTRVMLSKEDRRRAKAARHVGAMGMAGAALLEDLAGEAAGLVDAEELVGAPGRDTGADTGALRRTLAQKYGGELKAERAPRSGDAELLGKDSLGERRAKFDRKRARENAARDAEGDGGSGGVEREEDEFYRAAVEGAKKRRQEKQEARAPRKTLPPLPEPETRGARGITKEILKNRGLVPSRPRDQKNPRVKNRTKFEKALIRHKGQVPAMRDQEGAYGGEATGIRANLTKSRRLKS